MGLEPNKFCGRRVRPTRYAPPACKNPTSQAFNYMLAVAVDSACSVGVPLLKFVGYRPSGSVDMISVSAVIDMVTLTFDLVSKRLNLSSK